MAKLVTVRWFTGNGPEYVFFSETAINVLDVEQLAV